eukprot:TRINITY_DN12790_c0_g1_i1.p1 TRINITY_DN12790_c0_g1~~TRINITY_DN12790_c0_g1_i1.p1  ORF type:complete len:680 (-),score=111.79 TRINITY_DN12790_c0_g1_i1:151-2190(-)
MKPASTRSSSYPMEMQLGVSCLARFVALLLFIPVYGDLPIHCGMRDVAGVWTFRLGLAAPVQGRLPACGHSIPNTVTSMLAIKRDEIVPNGNATDVEVKLAEHILSDEPRRLQASSGTEGGSWTMVFDTGFEVRVGSRSFASHFFFRAIDNTSKPANGDNWEQIGEYVGRKEDGALEPSGDVYACHCNVTAVGWYHQYASDGTLESGCFWGVRGRSEEVRATDVNGLPTVLVRLRQRTGAPVQPPPLAAKNTTTSSIFGALFASQQKEPNEVLSGIVGDTPRRRDLVKEVFRLDGLADDVEHEDDQTRSAPLAHTMSLRGIRRHLGEQRAALRESALADATMTAANTSGKTTLDLPKNFDWRDELAGMVPPGDDPLGAQIDQGACGSCYAFAGTMVLQMRFRIQLLKQHSILYPLELSYKSVARCSPYTEGCSGGFSYFSARFSAEVGVPLASCDENVAAHALDEQCDWACFKNNSNIFYAKDYWHVGGFSQGSDEESIMREIYMNGPVELGFNTKSVPEFIVRSGTSHHKETNVMTVINNKESLTEPFSTNPRIRHWWLSTHAIIAVGWGEEEVPWGSVKFWAVRNSWGRDWGINGYAKMRRGNNDGGIEADATMVVPDLKRLPPGFLQRAKAYHESQAANRAAWKSKNLTVAESATKRFRGLPEYCKLRPDSVDCRY